MKPIWFCSSDMTDHRPRQRFWSGLPLPFWHVAQTNVSGGSRTAHGAATDPELACRYSPREMAEMSLSLFLAGGLTDEEYALLAFQPELHPDFERTIGALTGERANPDQPRDYLALWRDRLAFERNRDHPDNNLIEHIERILFVLRRCGAAADRQRPSTEHAA